jgi:hypothetical protein
MPAAACLVRARVLIRGEADSGDPVKCFQNEMWFLKVMYNVI